MCCHGLHVPKPFFARGVKCQFVFKVTVAIGFYRVLVSDIRLYFSLFVALNISQVCLLAPHVNSFKVGKSVSILFVDNAHIVVHIFLVGQIHK